MAAAITPVSQKPAKQKVHSSSGNAKAPTVDPLTLAYMLLVDSVTVQNNSANISAKNMQANAAGQEDLEQQMQSLRLLSIPKEIKNHHTEKKHIFDPHFTKHAPFFKVTKTVEVKYTTIKNKLTIAADKAMNQEISEKRNIVQQTIGVLQQNAQTGETRINTQTNASGQVVSESSYLVDILLNTTFDANLTQRPRQ